MAMCASRYLCESVCTYKYDSLCQLRVFYMFIESFMFFYNLNLPDDYYSYLECPSGCLCKRVCSYKCEILIIPDHLYVYFNN